jgi:hypothetical protein
MKAENTRHLLSVDVVASNTYTQSTANASMRFKQADSRIITNQ